MQSYSEWLADREEKLRPLISWTSSVSSPGLGQPPPIMFGIVDRVKLNHVLFGVSFLGWFNPCRKIELRTLEEVQVEEAVVVQVYAIYYMYASVCVHSACLIILV